MSIDENKKKRAPRVKQEVKEARDLLFSDISDLCHRLHARKDIELLTVITSLLHQNYDDRLLGATMSRCLVNGRLHVDISFNRGR